MSMRRLVLRSLALTVIAIGLWTTDAQAASSAECPYVCTGFAFQCTDGQTAYNLCQSTCQRNAAENYCVYPEAPENPCEPGSWAVLCEAP